MLRFRPTISVCIVLLAFMIFGLLNIFLNRQVKAIIKCDDKRDSVVMLPFKTKESRSQAIHSYDLIIKNSILLSGNFQIIPSGLTGSIRVNGKPIIYSKDVSKTSDNRNGFYCNIKPYLNKGINTVTITIMDYSLEYGLQVYDLTPYWTYQILLILIFLPFLYKPTEVYRLFKFRLSFFYRNYRSNFKFWLTILTVYCSVFALITVLKDSNFCRWMLISVMFGSLLAPILRSIYIKTYEHFYVISVFLLSLILCLFFLTYNLYDKYSYDVDGHIEYINYILENGHSPTPSGGWLFYHPSFYYRCASFFWKAINFNQRFDYEQYLKFMQAFSLYIYLIYSYVSVLTLTLIFKKTCRNYNNDAFKTSYRIAITLFLLWPINAIISGRIGNDIMFDLLYALAFYATVRWWSSTRQSDFLLMLLFTTLAIWSKSNGLILLPIISLLLIIKLIHSYPHKILRVKYLFMSLFFFLFMLSVAYFFLQEKINRNRYDPTAPVIVSNSHGLGKELAIQNDLRTFFTFDPVKFVEEPYTSALDPSKGRDNFWHFLFKTSLLGEFQERSHLLKSLASILSLSYLFLFPFFLIGFFRASKKLQIQFLMLTSLVFLVGSMIVFRIAYPYSSSNDFRYIYPAVLPFCFFVGNGATIFQNKFFNFWINVGIFIFPFLSVIYQFLNILKT